MDLAGSRLAAPGYVGDLDLADRVAAAADQLDEVPLADLGVVEVEHHLARCGWATPSTSAKVSFARANGTPGWSTMVLRFSTQNVTPAALTELADPFQCAQRSQPHLARRPVAGTGGLAVDEFGGVQVEPLEHPAFQRL